MLEQPPHPQPIALRAFYRDSWFLIPLAAGGIFWLGLWCLTPVKPLSWSVVLSWRFAMLALWIPCWEELVFRGFLQGLFLDLRWGGWRRCGITAANLVSAGLFTLGHFWQHSPGWAVAVLGPGLLFGVCRERYGSLLPAMVLHAFYNAGYFWVSGWPG